jgi:hypothetical protein
VPQIFEALLRTQPVQCCELQHNLRNALIVFRTEFLKSIHQSDILRTKDFFESFNLDGMR